LIKDRGQTEDLLRRIKQGAAFKSLAREFSICPSNLQDAIQVGSGREKQKGLTSNFA
jgi:parvulin-like peptidyl-prolyl isomerase